MRTLTAVIIVLFCLPFFDIEKGNKYYDFPDVIVKRDFKSMNDVYNGKVSFSLSFSGHYKESLLYHYIDSTEMNMKISINHPRLIDGKDFVIEKAKSFRMVMINEAHDKPQHRLFTKSVLKALYDQGFNVLMVEGMQFSTNVSSKGYPVDTDGVCTNEPTYASMIRYAKKIGFDLEVYYYSDTKKQPYWDDTIKIDERGSVKYISYNPKDSLIIKVLPSGDQNYYYTNIFERQLAEHVYDVMQRHPKSKFLMHVGYGHLNEYASSEMGAILKGKLNGEDFLTINQTSLDDQLNITDTLSHTNLKQNYPFFVEDGSKGTIYRMPRMAGDYHMFDATLRDSLARPSYLFYDVEHRYVYNIPDTFTGPEDYIFAAYPIDEYKIEKEHTIAVDVVYAKKGTAVPPLLLYKGKYALLRRGRDDVYKRIDIEIK